MNSIMWVKQFSVTTEFLRTFLSIPVNYMVLVMFQSLTVSSRARQQTTVGEIVNLMSVDAQRLEVVISYLWMIWSAPLQIFLAIYLLYGLLGTASFAGLGAMFIMIPTNGILATIQARLQVSGRYKNSTLKDELLY